MHYFHNFHKLRNETRLKKQKQHKKKDAVVLLSLLGAVVNFLVISLD